MKNKIIIYSILFSCAFFLSGCNSWLDLEPENSLTKSDFWLDENDIEAVVTSCYGALAQGSLSSNIYWTELRGGLVSPGTRAIGNREIMEFFDYNITANNSMAKWDVFYKVINYCNAILAHADEVTIIDPDLSTEQANFYKAEALALRAMCYLQLVKTFKEVPMVLKPFDTDANELQIEKQPEELVIAQVISDLKQALEWARMEYDTPELNLGRIRNISIKAMLADAYLWNNEYESCNTLCDEIINSYQFGLVNGQKYLSLFSQGNTSEGIFELQFDHSIGQCNTLYSVTANLPSGNMITSEFTSELFVEDDYRGDVVSVDFSSGSIWKYIGKDKDDRGEQRGSDESDANWIYYRLADINLMKAEALTELGQFDLAIIPLNLIRARAGLPPVATSENLDQMIELVLDERAREFIGEGKRWFDLVRVARRSPETRRTFILKSVLSNVSPEYISSTEDKVRDMNSWYLPIYYKELETNKKLEQNDFYKME